MPQIFDNIETQFHPALKQALELSDRADFCVGYFNLRGWRSIADCVERWRGGEGACCRVLVGMERLAEEELRKAFRLAGGIEGIDNATALRTKHQVALAFRDQLMVGAPTSADEQGLRQLSRQLRSRKVVVKLFLRHTLHAKLYLAFRTDPLNPRTAYLGSSNLTFSGLKFQGELNVDVKDDDATDKLQRWFNDRWNDRFCVDITDELAGIIDESWAGEVLTPPYQIYLKIAYHLSQEARAGLTEFQVPPDLRNRLVPFQSAAVRIAAHHLNKRGGVLIGDLVGLGKTLMASAVARVFQEDFGSDVLIICPVHLTEMWEDYVQSCRLIGRVLPLSRAISDLPSMRRYRVVLIDESQNLRNREGKRYKAIQEYISRNESRVIELSATPYNRSYLDLSAQLRLFIGDNLDLGIRPEQLIREIGETEFIRRHQCSPRTILGFEKSQYPDDWRELMRLYLVRRTRSFIRTNYAKVDEASGRDYLEFEDEERFYFPDRVARTVRIAAEPDRVDPYTRLYDPAIVGAVDALNLPRYGMGNYVVGGIDRVPTVDEAEILRRLSRGGRRLIGFSRTNLFKRLESGGVAFIQSVERHMLRNYVVLHAIDNDLSIPIGPQTAELLDAQTGDADTETLAGVDDDDADETAELAGAARWSLGLRTESEFRVRAAEVYQDFHLRRRRQFRWIRPGLFVKALATDLRKDCDALLGVLRQCGEWNPDDDTKLNRLEELLRADHSTEKVLVFTQYADTATYLASQLKARGLNDVEKVTGDVENPTALAWRFSPGSNEKQIPLDKQIRVLIATDVLSEGQNLQDCAIVVNYDLPWAIVKLIQRAGRVDRIGQQARYIYCYSFLPADGVERIIRLRARVQRRLRENAEVVGNDESFFEDDLGGEVIVDLYNEKSGILDAEEDTEIDLASMAFQIWKNAIDRDARLETLIPALPNVIYSTKGYEGSEGRPPGVLVYLRTADNYDALTWIDDDGNSVTESQLAILRAAECLPDTAAIPRHALHHDLVRAGVERVAVAERAPGGQLGRPSGARYRTYVRLERYARDVAGSLFDTSQLNAVITDVYRYPLRPSAVDTLNRQLRSGISDEGLAQLCITLRDEARLCIVDDEREDRDPQIICSLGLFPDVSGETRT
jgi:hypothetical protein